MTIYGTICVICRIRKVRSPAVAEEVKKIFPGCKVFAVGVQNNNLYDPSLLKKGVDLIYSFFPTIKIQKSHVEMADLYISVDPLIEEELKKQFPYIKQDSIVCLNIKENYLVKGPKLTKKVGEEISNHRKEITDKLQNIHRKIETPKKIHTTYNLFFREPSDAFF